MNNPSHNKNKRQRLSKSRLAAATRVVMETMESRVLMTFTPGNIAVLDLAAASNNTTGSVLELNPSTASQSSPVQTVAVAATGSNAIRFSDSGTSGFLSLTNDRTLLAFDAYNTTDTTDSDLATVTANDPASDRAVGTLNNGTNFTLQTTYTGSSTNQARSATSTNDSNWYITDKSGLYTNGATATTLVAANNNASVNVLDTRSFGGTVYVSSTKFSAGVSTLPSVTATTAVGLPGIPTDAAIQDFYLIQSGSNGSTYDVLYTLDQGTSSATINKFSLVSGTWVANGTAFTVSTNATGMIAATNGSGGAYLYVVTTKQAIDNSLVRLTDTAGYNANLNISTGNNVTLFTATGTNTLKGLDFAPLPVPTLTVTSSNSVVYNRSAYVPTVTVTGTAGTDSSPSLTYTYYAGTGTGGTNLGSTAPINVGTYTVVASSASDSLYGAGTSSPFTFNITAASVTASATGVNKTYDGTTAGTATYSLSGVIAGDVGNVSASGTATFASATVGTGIAVSVTGLTLSGSAAGNYSLSGTTASTTANITVATPTVVAIDAGGQFAGSTTYPATATVAGVVAGVDSTPAASLETVSPTFTYYSGTGTGGTNLGSAAPSAVGTYTVVANFAGSADYASAASSPVTFSISSLPTPTVTVTSGDRVYNQGAYVPTTTVTGTSGTDSTGAVTYTYYVGTGTGGTNLGTNSPVNAGTYTVVAHFAGDSTYLAADSSAKTFNITSVPLTATATGTNKTYDQTATDTVTISLTGVLTGDTVTAGATGAFADANIGTAKAVSVSGITLSGASAGNYTVNATTSTTANITAVTLTATATGTNKTYDATTADTVSISLSGVLSGDTVTASGTGAFADANIGTAKTVNVSGITLAGASAGNYTVNTTATTTANISVLTLTASITATDKAYDGTTAASATYSLPGAISGDAVTASGTATFAGKNVGAGLTVSATGITLSGAAAGNYSLASTSASTTANITAKPLTATITANNKTYDGSANAGVTYSLAGIVGSEAVTASGTATFAGAGVGTGIAVNATGIVLSGVASANYTVNSTASTAANISAKSVSATVAASNKTYDGTTTASVTYGISGLVGSDAVTAAGTSASFASANAGIGVVVNATGITLSGAAAGNYSLASTSASTTANIAPVALTATITASDKTYDRTTAAIATYSLTGGFVGSDSSAVTASGTATFANKNVGSGKTVTAASITLSGAAAGNYTVNNSATTTANITALAITGSITAANKQIDGTNTATIAIRTLSGVISGDSVSYVGGTATFATSSAGTGILVTATGLSLSGADAGNYTVNTTATSTADIIMPVVYSYVTDQSTYDLGAGQTVTVKIYLEETLNGHMSLIDGNGQNGLLGAGFEVVSGTQPTNPSLITAVHENATDFAGAPADHLNNSAVNSPNEADVLENVAITATTGVGLGNGNGAAANEVYLGQLTITAGSTLGTTTFSLGEFDVSGFNGGNTITNPDGVDVDTSGTVNGIPYTGVGSTVTSFSVNTTSLATPTVTVTSGDVVYSGNAYVPSATVSGIEGADTGATETYTYYAGSAATGTPLSGAPIAAGTYTVVANFAGDSSYAAANSAPKTFQITPKALTVTATGVNKTYDGTTAGSATYSLIGVVGSDSVSASGTATFASANVGTGVAINATDITLSGTAASNYSLASTSASTTANITVATPTVTVSVVVSGSQFTTTAKVAGINHVAGSTLETAGLTLTYYSGATATGTPLTSAPTTAGEYTVVANFAGSADYAAASSTPATFTTLADAPVFANSSYAFTPNETGTKGFAIGTVAATPTTAFTGQTITYSLTGTDAGAFAISSKGVITAVGALDVLVQSSFSFNVVATGTLKPSGTIATTVPVTVTVQEVAPTITGAAAGVAVADNKTVVPLAKVVIDDVVPTHAETVTVAIDPTLGSLTVGTTGFSAGTGTNLGTYTFNGTAAAATKAVDALVFVPKPNLVAPSDKVTETFTIKAFDGTDTTTNTTATVVSTSVNDIPTITGTLEAGTGTTASPTNANNITDHATATPFATVVISDPDVSDATPSLTPTAQTLTVTVSLDKAAKGTLADPSSFAGTQKFAAVTGTPGSYTVSGTPAQVTAAINALVFTPTAHDVAVGKTETTTFTISVNDPVTAAATPKATPTINSKTTVITKAVDDNPTISNLPTGNVTVNDNATVAPLNGVIIADVDNTPKLTLTVTLSAPANGTLSGGGFKAVTGAAGKYTFTGTVAQLNAALTTLTFKPTAHQILPNTTENTGLAISVTDGVGGSAVGSATVKTTAINTAPTLTGTPLPTATPTAVKENVTISPFSKVKVTDPDFAASETVTVSLDNSGKGSLADSAAYLASSAGSVAFAPVAGTPGSYSVTGSPTQVTAALEALVYTPAAHKVAPASTYLLTFTISITDGIVSGPTTDSNTKVNVTAVNTVPTLSGFSASQSTDDKHTLTPFTGVTVIDPDSSNTSFGTVTGQLETVTVTESKPTLGTLSGTGLTSTSKAGVYTLTGTAAAVTTELDALVFTPIQNVIPLGTTAAETLSVGVVDASGGKSSTTGDSTTITLSPVNDAPTSLAATLTTSTLKATIPAHGTIAVVASGTSVVTLKGTDPDAGDVLTYSLVTGTGSTNNADFVVGTSTKANQLLTTSALPAGTYDVRVQVTDKAGATFVQKLAITIGTGSCSVALV